MCGIAGFAGDFPAELVTRMGETLAHRGPDGAGEAVFPHGDPRGRVGLAHRRLAIIDLSSEGAQPITVNCPSCGATSLQELALTYNGEIYNYRELRSQLLSRGHTFHSQTDSEVVLHLYAERGPEMLNELNGIFAFALRDGRSRGRAAGVEQGDLLLARDPLGVKPLYLGESAAGVLFASEIKALLQCADLARELDLKALHSYLAYLWTPAPRTILRAVRKLPPGCAMLVRRGRRIREWRYYELPYGREMLHASESEVAREVADLVQRAVERQLVADVPVGAFLSGGLDSSAVVAMMRRARPSENLVTYCIGFPGGEDADGSPADLPFARRVAEHLGVTLHTLEVRPDMIDNLERMLWFLDEPQADPAPINALLISERAREDGFKVLLSGAGGDDIFSGYRRHRAMQLERFWRRLPRSMRGAVAIPGRLGAASGAITAPWARRAAKMLEHASLPPERRMIAYFWWSTEQLRRGLYAPGTAEALSGEDTAAPFLESLSRIPSENDPLNRMLFLEGKHFLADHNLNYTDKMGMAAGVEVRVPLLDLDLVDLATRIPPALKQKGAVGKAIFKKAMEPWLPADTIYRPKSGFGAPLRRWLRHELRERVEDALAPDVVAHRGVFDPAAVTRLIDADRAGQVDGAYTIFALMCLEIWMRLFLDDGVRR